jgi:hypothetical protein
LASSVLATFCSSGLNFPPLLVAIANSERRSNDDRSIVVAPSSLIGPLTLAAV